jgi:hypothetical protein
VRSIIRQPTEPAVTPYRRTEGSYDKCLELAEIRSFLNPYKKVYILNLVAARVNVNGNFCRTMLHFCFISMIEEKALVQNFLNRKQRERLKKPDWLKIKLGDPRNQNAVLDLISGLNLHTVCRKRNAQIFSNAGPIRRRRSCSAAIRVRGTAAFAP